MKKTTNMNDKEVEKPVRQLILNLASMPDFGPEVLDRARRSLLETAAMFAGTIPPGFRVMTFVERDTEELQHPHIHIIFNSSKS